MNDKITPPKSKFDMVGFMMEYESGGLDHAQVVNGFQEIINQGLASKLQGSYGRTAQMLIDSGECSAPKGIGAQNVGPFENISRDERRTVGNEEVRLVIYGQYNAMGLIDTSKNGIAILSDTRRQVLTDEIAIGENPAAKSRKFDELMGMSDQDFALAVNSNHRTRMEIELPDTPTAVRKPRPG